MPAQQLINKLQSSETIAVTEGAGGHGELLSPLTRVYLADVLDHVDTVGWGLLKIEGAGTRMR